MKLLRGLVWQIRNWDTSSKIALFLAFGLLPITFLIATNGPEDLRQPATIGSVGLLITSQLIVLWGNRGMVTPYTQAQRKFVDGDFMAARKILEENLTEDTHDVDALTLLANAYRYLGLLDDSEAIARHALQIKPEYHFALYGLGRTLLAKGQYQQALEVINKALSFGAPSVVKFDIGHCYFRLHQYEDAVIILRSLDTEDEEAYRHLMSTYILYLAGQKDAPTSDLIELGLPFWQASAVRFQNTPYGVALNDDIVALQQLQA